MTTKRETVEQLSRNEGSLGKADLDEHVFVLRAKDPAAVLAVRLWCNIARWLSCHSPEHIAEAEIQADAMQRWRDDRRLTSPWRLHGADDD